MSKTGQAIKGNADLRTVQGIATGDAGVLKMLYRDYFPMVRNLIVLNNGTEDEAKDIFQEAVIILYDKISQGEFELTSKLKTYLYSVCRRLWLKQLGGTSRTFTDISDYEELLPVEEDLTLHRERDRQFDRMEEALNKLGEPCRTIIRDFYLMNRSMQEICDKFGYTNTDNAKTQKYKCLQRLKKLFFTATG